MSRIWEIKNLPVPGSACLQGVADENGSIRIANAEGWLVAEISAGYSRQGVAERIARLLEDARDRGFEQGRAHVRRALGL